MKVLFLSSWFPTRIHPLNGDFVERHALAVAGICPSAAIHVQPDDHVKGKIFEVVERNDGALFEIIIYFKRTRSRIKPWTRLVNLCRYGRGYLIANDILKKKFGKPDIIHANIIYPAAIVARIWCFFTGTPYIISEHWTLYLSESSRIIPSPRITRWAVKKAFAVVPVTPQLGMAMRRHGYRGRYFVVPNVVDTDVFIPGFPSESPDKLKFLHVSSMKEEQKNITGILRTIKQLSMIRSDFSFTFMGEATAVQQTLPGELGVPEGLIVFEGERTHAEVAEQMRQSDVLVMFSRIENLPCAMLEAFSCGLPVISSDVGGIRDWIRADNGILVSSGNEDELLKALIAMFDSYKKYDKHALHQYAVDHFSRTVIAGKFREIYQNALKA
ncbi:MAG: glycosyltransferase [Bacteroidales bacterium]|nr:glycosyltransferase [Bacteroidales bacterium]